MAEKSGTVRIELLSDGFTELLSCAEVSEACRDAAEHVAAVAGDGFEVSSEWKAGYGGAPRIAYTVRAVTYEAKLAEAEDKVLTRAVQSCRV